MHLGLKSKVCMILLLVGSSSAWAQDPADPFQDEALEVEESFQQDLQGSATSNDPLSIQEPEVSAVEDEIEQSTSDITNEDLAEPQQIPEAIVEERSSQEELQSAEGLVAVPGTSLVEYEDMENLSVSYKERRRTHGAYFGFDYEPTFLSNFSAPVGGESYKNIFGETDIPMTRVSMDYKLNTGIGAFSLGIFYSTGSVTGAVDGIDHTLYLSRQGLTARFALDVLTDEPYVVPYVGVMGFQANLKDETKESTKENQYPFAYTWIAGAMFQLDWIDSGTALESRKVGLKNSFLDIFATQYAAVTDAALADTQTNLIVGGGLRLEF